MNIAVIRLINGARGYARFVTDCCSDLYMG